MEQSTILTLTIFLIWSFRSRFPLGHINMSGLGLLPWRSCRVSWGLSNHIKKCVLDSAYVRKHLVFVLKVSCPIPISANLFGYHTFYPSLKQCFANCVIFSVNKAFLPVFTSLIIPISFLWLFSLVRCWQDPNIITLNLIELSQLYRIFLKECCQADMS